MDQYEVLERIGKGAFGSALLVRHKEEKKKYVLKKIRLTRQIDKSAHQEMELISKVRNPFIVEYKDSWIEELYVCIVIGYCGGGDMAEVIKKAKGHLFPEEQLCKWLVQLLMALDYLHMNHILHRDVKCSNIFLTRDQRIRLGDFGLAKILTSDDLASSIVGTPSYMCPELLAGIPYGSKSDIWSLGCCIHEMTALKPAFKASDMQGLIKKINKSMATPLPASYSGEFRGLIKNMLRKSPKRRSSASELLKHPLLQPFVLQVMMSKSSPTQTMRSIQNTNNDVTKSSTSPDVHDDSMFKDKEEISPLRNNKTEKRTKPVSEYDSITSTQTVRCYPNHKNQRADDLQINRNHDGEIGMCRTNSEKHSNTMKIPRYSPIKAFTTPRKRVEPTKALQTPPNRESLPMRTPASKTIQSTLTMRTPASKTTQSTLPTRTPASKTIQSTRPTRTPAGKTIQSTLPMRTPASKTIQSTRPVRTPASKTIQPTLPMQTPASKTIQSTLPTRTPASKTIQSTRPMRTPASKTIQSTLPMRTPASKTIQSKLPMRTPASKTIQSTRRPSLPLPIRETPSRRNTRILHQVESLDISVNSPRIDRIAEFLLESSENPRHPIHQCTSAQGSCPATQHYEDRSITKDKCTIQIFRTEEENESDSSDRNPSAEGSNWGSSEPRQRTFDTLSYQQRAEALEALLDYSAQLLQQGKFEELRNLLKPFIPGKVSPRMVGQELQRSYPVN